jgi:hypothetical protein
MQTACWASGINFSKIGERAPAATENAVTTARSVPPNGQRSVRFWNQRPISLLFSTRPKSAGAREFASGNPIDGGDLVEWFAAWLPKVRTAIAAVQGQETEDVATVPGGQ